MKLGIGPWIGTINCAPESLYAHTHANVFTTNVTPPLSMHYARTVIGYGLETVYRDLTTYITIIAE